MYRHYISNSLLAFGGIFLLCTVFATDTSLANGVVSGKVHWFHLAMLVLAVCNLAAVLLVKQVKLFRFSMADGGVVALTAMLMLTYNWQLDPEPEKMLFGGQLVILWFLLRFLFVGAPQLKVLFLAMVVATGLLEALWGMWQLHGWENSNHSLFRLTGDFYNPGPYSGYLAMVLPICMWMVLQPVRKGLCYLAWATLLAIITVLPAGMSRTAWIAAAVSCIWVYWMERVGWEKTKQYIHKSRIRSVFFFILVLVSVTGMLAGIYMLKKDSANGRLLLWKVTGQAITKQPWSGTGLGGFPAAYAEAQAEYFTSGKASEAEMAVAGCPEYGFNEFLQIGLEQGVAGLLVFILLLGYSLSQGVKSKQTGAAGGILALIVFSLASYPLQLPEFWVALVVLMGVANSTPFDAGLSSSHLKRKMQAVAMIGILVVCCGWIFRQQKGYYQGYKKWNTLKILYNSKAYEAAGDGYTKLVPLLGHKPELLFEAAQCLAKTGHFAEANRLLERAMLLSCDPMIHYMAAKNEQSMGNYQKAETLLLHAINILPERLYPYYLLAKLYAEEAFFQEEKLVKAADIVLKKKPKVENTAIREMRTNIKNMLNNIPKTHN